MEPCTIVEGAAGQLRVEGPGLVSDEPRIEIDGHEPDYAGDGDLLRFDEATTQTPPPIDPMHMMSGTDIVS